MCIFNKKRVNSTSEVKNMDKISVVVPCYNEEEALPVYYKEMWELTTYTRLRTSNNL